jgi:hypothetical protein
MQFERKGLWMGKTWAYRTFASHQEESIGFIGPLFRWAPMANTWDDVHYQIARHKRCFARQVNPQHYLADLLARIADPSRHIVELPPWNSLSTVLSVRPEDHYKYKHREATNGSNLQFADTRNLAS